MGPFVSELEIDPGTAERVREEVRTTTTAELEGVDYDALGMITAVSVRTARTPHPTPQ